MNILEVTETVGSRRFQWGEGPVWHEDRLWHTDIEGHALVCLNPATEETQSWDTGERIGFLTPRRSGGFVIGGDAGLSAFDPETGGITPWFNPEPDLPDNRFNDGKADAAGRLWAGTISLVKKTGAARLYRVDADHSWQTAHHPVTNSNGLDWSSDNRSFFYIDTPTRQVLRFDFDVERGLLSNPEAIIRTDDIDASPDGMTMDAEGFLWIAFCHGGCVRRYHPTDGALHTELRLPVVEVTSVAFGGADLKTLFITTGKHKTRVEENAGAVFHCRPGVKGRPCHSFAG